MQDPEAFRKFSQPSNRPSAEGFWMGSVVTKLSAQLYNSAEQLLCDIEEVGQCAMMFHSRGAGCGLDDTSGAAV